MNVSALICSYKRPAVLHDTVCSLLRQHYPPLEIVICCPSTDHILEETLALPIVRFVLSQRGSTLQRNAALDAVNPATDLVAFFDDDIELCPSYLSNMVSLFVAKSDIMLSSGYMIADGGRGEAVSRQEALALCKLSESVINQSELFQTSPLDYGYGCNMVVRSSRALSCRFDERLALYAWLEDSDYSYHCTRGCHPPVTNMLAKAVHLGWRGGRISGLQMGYAQITNPVYLWRKAGVFTFRHLFIQYWMRCMIANCVGVIWGKAEDDRFNRLRGNGIALWRLATGKCDPLYVQALAKSE